MLRSWAPAQRAGSPRPQPSHSSSRQPRSGSPPEPLASAAPLPWRRRWPPAWRGSSPPPGPRRARCGAACRRAAAPRPARGRRASSAPAARRPPPWRRAGQAGKRAAAGRGLHGAARGTAGRGGLRGSPGGGCSVLWGEASPRLVGDGEEGGEGRRLPPQLVSEVGKRFFLAGALCCQLVGPPSGCGVPPAWGASPRGGAFCFHTTPFDRIFFCAESKFEL